MHGINFVTVGKFVSILTCGRLTFPFTKSAACCLVVCAGLAENSQMGTVQAADRNPNEPGWLPVVVATGDLRAQIDATPMEDRPYRPLHFYGNTVRRIHYRGTPIPRIGEVVALPVRVVGGNPGANQPERPRERRDSSRKR